MQALAEAENVGWKCPECGRRLLVRDGSTGEVVCSGCGLVVSDFECVPRFTPKAVYRGSFAVINRLGSGKPLPSEVRAGGRYLRMVGRREDKTLDSTAQIIESVAERVSAPKPVRETAMAIAKRVIRAMRMKRRRLRAEAVAVAALWCACRLAGFTVTMDEYEAAAKRCTRVLEGQTLLKLINRVEEVASLPRANVNAESYVARLAAKLEDRVHPRLVSAVASYAALLCRAAADEISGKDPVCAASTALCVADELMGGAVGKRRILELTGGGFSQSAATP